MSGKSIVSAVLLTFCSLTVWAYDVVTDTLGVIKSVATSPAELLKGKVAGVRVSAIDGSPDGELNVNIRGINTLRGDSQPLWIVDGAVIGSSIRQNLNTFFPNGGVNSAGEPYPNYTGYAYTSPINDFAWLNPGEIESVEVLTDIAATSLYGMAGANGVVIVKTRKAQSVERNIHVSANAGADISNRYGPAFKTGVNQFYELGINGMAGVGSFYNVSAFVRNNSGFTPNNANTVGGLAVKFDATANSVIQFGLNSFLSYADGFDDAGVNFIGSPSLMILSRYPTAYPTDPMSKEQDTIEGWMKDYDGKHIDFRSVNSTYLNFRFMPKFNLRITGGLDYRNQTRYFWYGNATSVGKHFGGLNGILNNSLCNYNIDAVLSFERSVFVDHTFSARADFNLDGYMNRTNDMCGSNFELHSLRWRSIKSSTSRNQMRRLYNNYNRLGALAALSYNYKEWAGISASVGFDWTLRFDTKPVILPAASAYVDLRKIFLNRSDVVSNLKITGGYGHAGNEVVLPYEFMSAYIDNVPETEVPGVEVYYKGLNRLISKEYNVGIQAGFDHGRYNVSLKYYDKKTSDSFTVCHFGTHSHTLWEETRYATMVQQRISSISNQGIEADVDLRLMDRKEVKWTLYANAAYRLGMNVVTDEPGQTLKIENGMVKNDPALMADYLPKLHGGFGTAVNFFNVTFDAALSGASGFNIINANVLSYLKTGTIEDWNIEKGDFLRLDHVSLSYDVPIKAKWIKGLRFSLSGHNLMTITGYSGWNPDVNCFGVTVRGCGVDYGSFPIARRVMFGVNLRF